MVFNTNEFELTTTKEDTKQGAKEASIKIDDGESLNSSQSPYSGKTLGKLAGLDRLESNEMVNTSHCSLPYIEGSNELLKQSYKGEHHDKD